MWRGPVVFVLVVLAFGAGLLVGLGIDRGDRRERALASQAALVVQPPATAPSRASEPAHLLTEPAAPAPTPVPSARTDVAAAQPSKGAASSPTKAQPEATSGSITVHVVDARGAPIPGAALRKRAEANGPGGPAIGSDDFRFGNKLYADSSGRAVLAGVPFGTYRVIAEMEDLAPAMSEPVRVSAENPEASAQVTLTPGGDVAGELHDVHGAPAAAIQLSIHPDTMLPHPPPLSLRQVYTEADGTFTFRRLPPGHYKLYTRAQGEDEIRVPEQSLDVEVVEGQTTRVKFKDISATAVQIAGQVLRNGQPLMRAHVMVQWADSAHPYMMRTTETDAQGRFELTLDAAGEYRFSVAQPGRSSSTMFRETIPQVARHELVLAFATASISGRVLATNGDPLPGAEVRAMSQGQPDAGQPSGGGAVTTDGTGHYLFADWSAGSYRLTASPPRNGASSFEGQGQSDVLVLEPGAELRDVDVRLTTGGAVEGRVHYGDGTPAAKAEIEGRASRYQRGAVADAQGAFAIHGLLPGPLWLRAVSGHDCSPWISVTVAASETAQAELVVAPGTIVSIEVTDANGPAATASVSLSDGNERTVHVALVRDGKGHTAPVPPGTYTVIARRDWRDKNGPKTESTITLNGEPEQVLRLRLP